MNEVTTVARNSSGWRLSEVGGEKRRKKQDERQLILHRFERIGEIEEKEEVLKPSVGDYRKITNV